MVKKLLGTVAAISLLAVGATLCACDDRGDNKVDPNAGMPEITCTAQSEAYTVTQGRTMTEFPLIVCKLDGKSMKSSDYTVVDELDPDAEFDIMSGTFKSNVIGEHVIKVTATNPNDKTKVATTSFRINVYRRILALGNAGNVFSEQWVGDPLDPVPSQWIRMDDTTNSLGILNMNASKRYYAEGYFQGLMKLKDSIDIYGFAHVADFMGVEGVKGLQQTGARWLGCGIQSSSMIGGYANGLEERTVTTYVDVTSWSGVDYGSQVNTYFARHFDEYGTSGYDGAVSADTSFKFAVARDGDWFYAFVNDELVSAVTSNYYGSIDTVPSFWARLHYNVKYEDENIAGGWSGKKIENIDFYDGDKAVSKINALLEEAPAVRNWGANFAADAVKNGTVTIGDVTAEKGVNFKCVRTDTGTNGAAMTIDRALGTDFTLSFDYKPSELGTTRGDFLVDVRTSSWKNTVMQYGGYFNNDLTTGALSFNIGETWTDSSVSYGDGFDISAGVRVKLERDLQSENERSVYRVTFTSLANPEHVLVKTYADTSGNWNAIVYPVFKNRNLAGEWTDITLVASDVDIVYEAEEE